MTVDPSISNLKLNHRSASPSRARGFPRFHRYTFRRCVNCPWNWRSQEDVLWQLDIAENSGNISVGERYGSGSP
jgi:hypothetical protein